MTAHPLSSTLDVDALAEASFDQPQIIFKHSITCSISAMAKSRVDRALRGDKLTQPVHVLDLLRHRDVSDYIATKFGVRHESPQLIVVDRGEPAYVATHLDIDPAALAPVK